MTLPDTFTIDELMLALARVKPAPTEKFCRPCARCLEESPGGVTGLYTDEGLKRHKLDVHGEVDE